MKDKMVLGGIAKEGIKIYYQKKRDKRIAFYLSVMGMTLLYSLITGDWGLAMAGLVFSTITITADSATQFESGGAEYNAVVRLADDKFVIAFRDIDDNNKGKVIIGTRSGTTITISNDSATIFESGQTDGISICSTDSTHFVVSYRDITDTNKGKVVACSVSGTTITVGSIATFETDVCVPCTGICSLDSTYFVIIWGDTTNDVFETIVGSLSGTTITLGSAQSTGYSLETGQDTQRFGITDLSSTKIVIGGVFTWVTTQVKVGVVTTGAKTIAFGSGVSLGGEGAVQNVRLENFDDVYFIIARSHSGSATGNSITTCSVSGNVITAGSGVDYNSGSYSDYISVCCMDSTHFIISYKDVTNSNKGTVRGGSISGTTITMDADGEIVFENGNTGYPNICQLMSNYFVIALKDNN